MHTVTVDVHDSIYDQLISLLGKLPKDKIRVEETSFPAIDETEAKQKVARALESINEGKGQPLDTAFENIRNAG